MWPDVEYEVKLPVDGHDEVRERLRSAGAVPVGSARQDDTYFEHPCRDLAGRDEAVRLRRVGDTLELTFKGAKRGTEGQEASHPGGGADDGSGGGAHDDSSGDAHDDSSGDADDGPAGDDAARPIKARPEVNVQVLDDPAAWLTAVGFRPSAHLRKHRERWLLGHTEVSLDHIDGLGHFVEIEALPEAPDGTSAVLAVQERLGLQDVASTLRSYLELALAAGAAGAQAIE